MKNLKLVYLDYKMLHRKIIPCRAILGECDRKPIFANAKMNYTMKIHPVSIYEARVAFDVCSKLPTQQKEANYYAHGVDGTNTEKYLEIVESLENTLYPPTKSNKLLYFVSQIYYIIYHLRLIIDNLIKCIVKK